MSRFEVSRTVEPSAEDGSKAATIALGNNVEGGEAKHVYHVKGGEFSGEFGTICEFWDELEVTRVNSVLI
jgi:hypothetical protein